MAFQRAFCVALVTVGVAAAFWPGPGRAESDGTIKIGALFQMTGPEAEYGRHGIQGARLAEKEINERGGVLGRMLQILVAHEGDAVVGGQEARKFIREKAVDFLMGVDSSSAALAVSQEAKAHRTIVLFTHASASPLTGKACHRYAFRLASSALMDARAAAVVMRDKPAKRWYGIGPDSDPDREAWEVFQTALRKLRPDALFVGESWTRVYTTDYTAVLNAALDAEPDAIWSTLWGWDLVTFIKQARHLGFFERVKFFVNPGGASLGVLVPLGEEMPGGLWVSAGYWFLHPDSVENRVFVNAYRALYAEYPADVALASYSAIHLLRRVIEEVGSVDTEKIVERLEGLTYRDPEGVKTVRREDHQVVKDSIWGRTSKADGYPFRILDDLVVVPVREIVRAGDDTGCRMEQP